MKSASVCQSIALQIIAAGLLYAPAAAYASPLFEQDFGGNVTHSSTPTLSAPSVSGFVRYSFVPAVQLPAVQLPAVQLFTLNVDGYTFSLTCYPSRPCVQITLSNTSDMGVLTAITALPAVQLPAVQLPAVQLPAVQLSSDYLFLPDGSDFYIAASDPIGDCPTGAAICGTLDFTNSSPRTVPTPPELPLFAAGLALIALTWHRDRRRLRTA